MASDPQAPPGPLRAETASDPFRTRGFLVLDPEHRVTMASHSPECSRLHTGEGVDAMTPWVPYISRGSGCPFSMKGPPQHPLPSSCFASCRVLQDYRADQASLGSRYVRPRLPAPLCTPCFVIHASNKPQMCFQGVAGERGHLGTRGFPVSSTGS